mmetsp:Transcript_6236/g.18229  ORF Transcript_6236/g.18229 Transcript_6236/m.18229 type:complete len:230 (+) Transcript_6236:1157-1846(+)
MLLPHLFVEISWWCFGSVFSLIYILISLFLFAFMGGVSILVSLILVRCSFSFLWLFILLFFTVIKLCSIFFCYSPQHLCRTCLIAGCELKHSIGVHTVLCGILVFIHNLVIIGNLRSVLLLLNHIQLFVPILFSITWITDGVGDVRHILSVLGVNRCFIFTSLPSAVPSIIVASTARIFIGITSVTGTVHSIIIFSIPITFILLLLLPLVLFALFLFGRVFPVFGSQSK